MTDHEEVPQQARIARDGHIYLADPQTRRALDAVKQVDPHTADALWHRWREDGRIRPDLEAERRQGIAPEQTSGHHPSARFERAVGFEAADDQAPRQGHRR